MGGCHFPIRSKIRAARDEQYMSSMQAAPERPGRSNNRPTAVELPHCGLRRRPEVAVGAGRADVEAPGGRRLDAGSGGRASRSLVQVVARAASAYSVNEAARQSA